MFNLKEFVYQHINVLYHLLANISNATIDNLQTDDDNEILTLNNRIGDLQHELERAEITARRAETEWNSIQTTAAGKTLELGSIIL